MSAKWTLNIAAMQEDFFADTALIGIASALPAYRLCWVLNEYFDINLVREPELDICLQSTSDHQSYFPIYQYCLPHSEYKHLLYKLKCDKESLLPEAKQLDYLWMVQSVNPDTDAQNIIKSLRGISDIQLAQLLLPEKLKNISHLLI